MLSLLLAFAAGLLTILNPCVLPLVPVLVAGAAARDIRGPLALAFGLALTFGIVGGLVAAAGAELGDNPVLRIASALVMLGLGLALAVPAIATWVEMRMAPVADLGNGLAARVPGGALTGQVALGALLALIWGPCVGPTLGAALVLAAGQGTLPLAMLTMGIFALGAATSLLVAGYGLGRLSALTRARTRRSVEIGKRILGWALIVIGLLALTGLDRELEAQLVAAMPDWLVSFATQL